VSRGRRPPTPDELRLWAEVAKTVAPLGDRSPPDAPASPEPAPERAATPAALAAPRASRRTTAAPALADLDRRTVSRLSRGTVAIDARIDLHGMTQQAAHGRLVRFLREAQAGGARLVLVITGKGRPGAEADYGRDERGVLRRAVPDWLSAAEMRPFVVGFGEAAVAHGGAGALYVRIRRARVRDGGASAGAR
jgi:DNA-nicking Smr family endonuclease